MAEDCPCQPMSLNALLVVKDAEALREFIRFGQRQGGRKHRRREEAAHQGRAGEHRPLTHPTRGPTMWHVRDNFDLRHDEPRIRHQGLGRRRDHRRHRARPRGDEQNGRQPARSAAPGKASKSSPRPSRSACATAAASKAATPCCRMTSPRARAMTTPSRA
jgi:hypothetical protein